MANKQRLRVAVVGAGGIGHTHARVYHAHPQVELVAVCDIIPSKAEAFAEEFQCQAFFSVDDMLAHSLALDVTTKGVENGSEHYAPTMALLKAGIAVLGEKPISNRIAEAEEMVQFAHNHQIPYAINLNHRFTPAAERAKHWLDEGRLGRLHMVNMRLWINNPVESSPWFHLRALHPHSIDILRYFGGDIARVGAFMLKGEGREIWSNTQMLLQFQSGALGHLVGSYDAGGSFGLEQLELVGSEGRVVIEEACERLTFYSRRSIETESYQYLGGMRSFNETFQSRIAVFVDQLLGGVPALAIKGSGLDALRAQRLIEAAIESWERGSIIQLSKDHR
jgi:predicted dehydrogenase